MVLLIIICFQYWLKQSIVCYSMSITRSDHCILNTCMLVVLWYDLLEWLLEWLLIIDLILMIIVYTDIKLFFGYYQFNDNYPLLCSFMYWFACYLWNQTIYQLFLIWLLWITTELSMVRFLVSIFDYPILIILL